MSNEYCSNCREYVEARYIESKTSTNVHCTQCNLFIRSYNATHVKSIDEIKNAKVQNRNNGKNN